MWGKENPENKYIDRIICTKINAMKIHRNKYSILNWKSEKVSLKSENWIKNLKQMGKETVKALGKNIPVKRKS